MENLDRLEFPALVDMLSRQTEGYTRMLKEGGDKLEFEQCKMSIALLQDEIAFRRETFDRNTPVAGRRLPDFIE